MTIGAVVITSLILAGINTEILPRGPINQWQMLPVMGIGSLCASGANWVLLEKSKIIRTRIYSGIYAGYGIHAIAGGLGYE